jgi:3-phosphoshikimate 1-carboxyvinyltransferase
MIVTPQKVLNVDLKMTAPPSKSYTHRALIAGALAEGTTTVLGPLDAEDTRLTAEALMLLGVKVKKHPGRIVITGCDGDISNRGTTTLDLENSGTSLRLLTSLGMLCRHPVVLTGSARMQERPIGPLVQALNALGGSVDFLGNSGFPPIRVSGKMVGGPVTIDGSMSSQFISSILMTAPYAAHDVEIKIPAPPSSASYLDITADVMQAFSGRVTHAGYDRFLVSTDNRYKGRAYTVEGDWSSASYFFAIAAICGGKVTVDNLVPTSVQGDRRFPDALAAMGCTVSYGKSSVTVEGARDLQGITIDMATSPDTVQTLCMVAAMARTPTTITGISHLKFKESDRISETAERLRSMGGRVEVSGDALTLSPAPLHGGTVDPANDHRTAMSFTVLGLGTGGITITNAECVNKSFPGFWDELRSAGVLV